MSASAPPAKKLSEEPSGSELPEAAADASPPPPRWPPWARWALRLALVATLLSLIGYFSGPAGVSPLLCKIYG